MNSSPQSNNTEHASGTTTNLRSIRKSKNISQVELAVLVGVSQSCISQAERDPKMLSLQNWKRICEILDTDVHDLLPAGTTFRVYQKISV